MRAAIIEVIESVTIYFEQDEKLGIHVASKIIISYRKDCEIAPHKPATFSGDALRPPSRRRRYEQVADIVEEAKGVPVSPSYVGKQLGISRRTASCALQHAQAFGLVEKHLDGGWIKTQSAGGQFNQKKMELVVEAVRSIPCEDDGTTLVAAVIQYLGVHHSTAKRWIWQATTAGLIKRINRFRIALSDMP